MTLALIDLLALFYKTGNLEQMEAIARGMLSAVPNDMVALQFLGLAFYLKGRTESSYRVFRRYAASLANPPTTPLPTSCEQAATASYLAATRPASGLAEGWGEIARILERLGFDAQAARAAQAARSARIPQTQPL